MPQFIMAIPREVEILGPNKAGVECVRGVLVLPTKECPTMWQGKTFSIGDGYFYMIQKVEEIEIVSTGPVGLTRYRVEGGRYLV